jgi:hypothetical protein
MSGKILEFLGSRCISEALSRKLEAFLVTREWVDEKKITNYVVDGNSDNCPNTAILRTKLEFLSWGVNEICMRGPFLGFVCSARLYIASVLSIRLCFFISPSWDLNAKGWSVAECEEKIDIPLCLLQPDAWSSYKMNPFLI